MPIADFPTNPADGDEFSPSGSSVRFIYNASDDRWTGVESDIIANGTIETDDLADNAVTNAKVADSAIDTAELAADAVTGDKIEDDAVDSEHIADDAVGVAHLNTDSDGNTDQVLTRTSSGMNWADVASSGLIADAISESSVTGTVTVFSDVDLSDYSTATFSGYAAVTKSGGSGAGSVSTQISFDGGTTYTTLVTRTSSSDGTSEINTAISVDISSVSTASIIIRRNINSGTGSGRTSTIRGLVTLGNGIS